MPSITEVNDQAMKSTLLCSIFTRDARPGGLARLLLVGTLLLCVLEPALANKFETIGGGVSGSKEIKLEWLQGFLYVAGGISLLSAFMAVLVPHDNPLFLNFRNWKQSAAVLLVISGFCFAAAFAI